MTYDRECSEAAERLFLRIAGHLQSIRDTFNLALVDCAIDAENNALLSALEVGDPMEVESELFDIDNE